MNKQAIEAYLRRLQKDNANVPESDRDSYPEIKAITDALAILTTATAADDFLIRLREKRDNEQNKEADDKAYQTELINWYNIIIDYVEGR